MLDANFWYKFHCQLWCCSWEAQMFTVPLSNTNKNLLFLSDTNQKSPFMSLTVGSHTWLAYQVTSSSFLSLFYFPLLAEDFGHHLLFFCVLVFNLGIISATYNITDLRDGNWTRQRLPSSSLSWTRTLPLYWTSRFHSLEYILFFSRNTLSPTAEHTSWISVAVGFSTALLMGIRLPSAMVFLLFK